MCRRLIYVIMIFVLVSLSFALIIDENQLISLSNEDIANYMANSINLTGFEIKNDYLYIYYDLAMIDKINETHYKIGLMNYKTYLKIKDLNYYLNIYDVDTVFDYLINGLQPIIKTEYISEIDLSINRSIIPCKLQAYNKGFKLYNRALELRDERIRNNQLIDDLGLR